jgi:hypothetical protein
MIPGKRREMWTETERPSNEGFVVGRFDIHGSGDTTPTH